MTTLVTSASQADGAVTTSTSVAYNPALTVECSITNGAGIPTTPGKVRLELSADNANWVPVDSRWTSSVPSQTYWQAFRLGDYVGAQQFRGADALARLGGANLGLQWTNFRVVFYNNTGAAITVFANYG